MNGHTYDDSCGAVYIYLESPKTLSIAETDVVGIRHGETIEVGHPYWVNVDTDNFGRLRGVELLNGKIVAERLPGILIV